MSGSHGNCKGSFREVDNTAGALVQGGAAALPLCEACVGTCFVELGLERTEPHPGAGLSDCGAPGRSQCQKVLGADGAASVCQVTRLWAHLVAFSAVVAARLVSVRAATWSLCCGC